MTSAVVLPDFSVIVERRKLPKRPMTYQVIFSGVDGVVVASDKLESCFNSGQWFPTNKVTKIGIAGKFAWTCSGGPLATTFFDYFGPVFKDKANELNAEEAVKFLEECANPVCERFKNYTGQPGGLNQITFVCGASGGIVRSIVSPGMSMHPIEGGYCINGQESNHASLLALRIYSGKMQVSSLISLAAYAVLVAHELDSSCIDGLDIAVYRKGEKGFRFIETETYDVSSMEEAVRRGLADNPLPIKYKEKGDSAAAKSPFGLGSTTS